MLDREWRSGDVVELELPMAPRVEARERGAIAVHLIPYGSTQLRITKSPRLEE